jgi:energy-coupling factor transport system permease protein
MAGKNVRPMLKAINPLTKLVICAVWILAATLILDARFLAFTTVVFALALVILNRTSPMTLLLLMVPFALFGFGFLTTNLLFREESGYAATVSSEAVFASDALSARLTLALRAIACGMISVFFALTTDPGAFVRALMAQAKLPAKLGYPLFAAMQLVPQLAREAQQIRMARAMHSGRPLSRLPTPVEVASLVVPLLAFAIRRAGRSAISMDARGFDPAAPRTIIDVPGFSRSDVVFALAAIALLAAAVSAL